jgi:hypothetical protein
MAYLESIRPTRSEKHSAKTEMAFAGVFTNDLGYKRNLVHGEIDYWIDQVLTDLTKCRNTY